MTREPTVAGLVVQPWDGRRESTVDQIVSDIASGLRVFRSRDGFAIPEELILDRARNIACALIGNYSFAEIR